MTTLSSFQAEQQNDQVLSTLNRDGSRRWIDPKPSKGRFLRGRRAVAYLLIAIFTLIPYIRMNGKPLMLLDVAARRFTIFGYTFLPTDTILLMLLMVSIFVTVFMVTALFGRVWCGWGCPQTVYMEFVYRPLERLLEGKKVGGKVAPGRKVLKYVVYLLISMFLAHTFLAYFVGVERLAQWVQRSPFEHPSSFFIMAGVTAMMMFDFCFFREQMCIVTCPYGRFQSVMLDRQSLIISYDKKRGEPRGKMRKGKGTTLSLPVIHDPSAASNGHANGAVTIEQPVQGDCIDCRMCVHTCPTGIDIRNGLQMECIACAQCIDACDAVMEKIDRPRGLIRYSSQAAMEGQKPHLFRARLALYGLVLTVLASLFTFKLVTKSPTDVSVLRGAGAPFNVLSSGEITNQLKIRITNRTDRSQTYTISALEPGVRVQADANPVTVQAGQLHTDMVLVVLPRELMPDGHKDVTIMVASADGFHTERGVRLLGPVGPAPHHGDHDDGDTKGHRDADRERKGTDEH